MRYIADHAFDAYISALPDWQQAICREVRDLVHAADPDVVETIKRTDRPYFVLQGNTCPARAKDHVNVFLYDARSFPIPTGSSRGTWQHNRPYGCGTARRNRQTRQPSPPCSSTSCQQPKPAAGASWKREAAS